jgi:uncharacterized protein YlxW (UPF0749 family)
MKTKVAIIIVAGIVAVASLCIADSGGSSPKPTADLAALRAELRQTQAQLELVVNRTSALEAQVRDLQRSNAELQQAIEKIGKPGPILVH